MLRTGFRTSAPARDPDRVRAVPKPVPGAFRVAVPVTGIPVSAPKGPAAKPGKRAPTAQEARWMDAIVRYGCVACRIDGGMQRAPAVHHILRGGVRLGHAIMRMESEWRGAQLPPEQRPKSIRQYIDELPLIRLGEREVPWCLASLGRDAIDPETGEVLGTT